MTFVARTIYLPPELLTEVQAEADDSWDGDLSAFVRDALDHSLRNCGLRRALIAMDEKHGGLTEDEMAETERELRALWDTAQAQPDPTPKLSHVTFVARTVYLAADQLSEAQAQARDSHAEDLSGLVRDALAHRLRHLGLGKALDAWEAVHGAPTDEQLAAAAQQLGDVWDE